MKADIHPELKPTIFVDTSCGAEFVTFSTIKGEDTRTVDGTDYQVYRVEISSGSHPFYTGKQILVDTARRVEKFEARTAKQEAAAGARKGKKVKQAARKAIQKAAEDAAEAAKKATKNATKAASTNTTSATNDASAAPTTEDTTADS